MLVNCLYWYNWKSALSSSLKSLCSKDCLESTHFWICINESVHLVANINDIICLFKYILSVINLLMRLVSCEGNKTE